MRLPWKAPKSEPSFRSAERDAQIDASRIKLILDAIDKVARDAEAERAGLQSRLSDVLSRSSVTMGTDSDEYLTRDALTARNLTSLSAEIRYAEERLKQIGETAEYYRALHAFTASALQSRRDLGGDASTSPQAG